MTPLEWHYKSYSNIMRKKNSSYHTLEHWGVIIILEGPRIEPLLLVSLRRLYNDPGTTPSVQ